MSRAAVVAGQCAVSYLGLVSRLPEPDEAVEIAEFSQQGGGAAATAAATLAVLGAPSRFVGKVADDHFGQFLCRGLEQLEVDVRFLLVERGKVSPFSYIAVEAGSGRRQIHRSRGNVSKLQPTEIDVNAVLDEANLLVIDGQMPAVQLELADAASKRGIPVIWDAHTTLAETERMLAYTTVLLASERFAMEVAQVADLEQGLRQITELGPETCVITLGDEGAVGVSKDHPFHREEAFSIDVVDTTDVGHVYSGAFVYAIVQKWPLARAMKFASVAAGLACKKLGARAGIPNLPEVMASFDR